MQVAKVDGIVKLEMAIVDPQKYEMDRREAVDVGDEILEGKKGSQSFPLR